MMTSSNGNIFRVTDHLCGEFTGHRWIPTKASDAELWCFFDLRMSKRLSEHSRGWWFETPSRPLWRHCNGYPVSIICSYTYLCRQTNSYNTILWNLAITRVHPKNYAHGISNYIHNCMQDVITHPCPNFKGCITKASFELTHGWVITPYCFTWM